MKRLLLMGLVLLLVFVLSGCGSKESEGDKVSPGEGQPVVTQPESPPQEEQGELNPLTGEKVTRTGKLVAVMVDNLPAARPQTGLIDADVVYEIEAEGQIARFMALFYGEPPENVGPVRSARPYYMALAKEWDAYYAHVGGSDDAFAKVKEWKIRDVDDTRGHPGFWVDNTRKRPNSTYLNLDKALSNKPENGSFKDWQFVDPPGGAPDYRQIRIRYLDNRVKYVFDEGQQAYLRYIFDEPHTDRETKEQIAVRNVIIQYARHRNLNDALKHIDVEVIGEGPAEYFLGGKYMRGTWKKKDLNAHTQFLAEDGTPVKLVRGNTYIQVVRSPAMVEKDN
ncbi:hypothetical protein SY88_08515 [Clostridiales bacterium PH28_bin88]|nr:hypothetical protein SY88_08515 [Clostridiales bacterium PH28_bin88]